MQFTGSPPTVITSLFTYRWFAYSVANAIFFSLGVSVGIVSWFPLMLFLIHRNHDRLNPTWIRRLLSVIGVFLTGLGVWSLF